MGMRNKNITTANLFKKIAEEAESLILAERKMDRWYGGMPEKGETRSLRDEASDATACVSSGQTDLGEATSMQLLLKGDTPECADLSASDSASRFAMQVVPTKQPFSASTSLLLFTCLADCSSNDCIALMQSLCAKRTVERAVLAVPRECNKELLDAVLSAALSQGVAQCIVVHMPSPVPQPGGARICIASGGSMNTSNTESSGIAVEDAARVLVGAATVDARVIPTSVSYISCSATSTSSLDSSQIDDKSVLDDIAEALQRAPKMI